VYPSHGEKGQTTVGGEIGQDQIGLRKAGSVLTRGWVKYAGRRKEGKRSEKPLLLFFNLSQQQQRPTCTGLVVRKKHDGPDNLTKEGEGKGGQN